MFYKKTLVIILEFRVECRVGFVLVIGRQAVLQEIRKVHRNCDTHHLDFMRIERDIITDPFM